MVRKEECGKNPQLHPLYRKLYIKGAKWLAIKQMCVKESKNIFRGKVWSGTDLYTLGISAEQNSSQNTFIGKRREVRWPNILKY